MAAAVVVVAAATGVMWVLAEIVLVEMAAVATGVMWVLGVIVVVPTGGYLGRGDSKSDSHRQRSCGFASKLQSSSSNCAAHLHIQYGRTFSCIYVCLPNQAPK